MRTREEWVECLLNQFKGSREDILDFISRFGYCDPKNDFKDTESDVRELFISGYCYYFAKILEQVFGGQISWHKGYSHIVLLDTDNDICYDFDGVFYDYNKEDIVPFYNLREQLESFRHRETSWIVENEQQKQWINDILDKYNDCNENIVNFISRILFHCKTTNDINNFFKYEYCYYFAKILEDAFEGEIYWYKGFKQVVFKSGKYFYDIDGVLENFNEHNMVPISEMPEELLEYFFKKEKYLTENLD